MTLNVQCDPYEDLHIDADALSIIIITMMKNMQMKLTMNAEDAEIVREIVDPFMMTMTHVQDRKLKACLRIKNYHNSWILYLSISLQ